MSHTQSTHNTSQTCTCSDCVLKSKEGTIYGSRIDELYYDKYLPLRERKLLDKLVRTRGVYDDVRNRILSLSSVDVTRELDEAKSFESKDSVASSVVQRLVALVDKGEYPPLRSPVHLHSDCCGCCVCSSKTRIQKHRKVHMHIPSPEHIDRYVESHRGKMRKKGRKVAINAAKSDPCMCTLKFSKRPRNHVGTKKEKITKKPVHKKTETAKLRVDIKNCECPYEPVETVKSSISKKSVVLFKKAENKMRDSIRSTVTKIENVFHIKKDSLMIYREKLQKKQAMKAWECDPDFCIPNECNPDECYEKIKRREAKKMNRKAHYHDHNISDTQTPRARQVSPKKMVHKESSTEYELKRCFCTQKLGKPQKIKPKRKPAVKKIPKTKSKNSITCKCEKKDSVSTQTKKKPLAKTQKSETVAIESTHVIERKTHDLLPYECEPYFCIPGDCNPIVCEDRIKHRQLKNKIISKDTNTLDISQKTKKKRTDKSKPLHTPIGGKSKSSPNAPRKQAVRISSSFRFDIEFFKEKNFPDSLETTNTSHNKYREKSISNNTEESKSLNEVKINPYNEQAHTTLPARNQQSSQDPILKRCFCTLKLHKTPKQKPKRKRPKSKMTMTVNEIKETTDIVICKCKKINVDCICEPDKISIKSQASMTIAEVNHILPPLKHSTDLLPYECEPLFCIPGKCDPIVCEKRIMTRNIKPKTLPKRINTEPKRSTKTITSKSATSYSVKQTQPSKRKKIKTKDKVRTELHAIPYADKSKSAPNAPHRPAVKISSSFRFDIEFYKDVSNLNDDNKEEERSPSISKSTEINEVKMKQISVEEIIKPQKTESRTKKKATSTDPITKCFCKLKRLRKPKEKKKKYTSKKTMTDKETAKNVCECRSMPTQTKKAFVKPPIPQTAGLLPYECEPNFCTPGKCNPLICEERIKMRNRNEEEKEPLLKRCFCTLKFHNENNAKRNRAVIPLQNNLEVIEVKSTGTDTNKMKNQKKSKDKLLPHQCEPGVCVPGECDPIECLKLIKKRNLIKTTLKTKYVSTESPKTKSVISGAITVKRKRRLQSTDNHEDQNYGKTEKSSNTTLLSSENPRQSVKLGSECSFSIEFSKNKSQNETSSNHNNRKIKIKRNTGVKLTKERNTRKTQRNKKQDKSLTQVFKLDRCFCTLKLSKKGNQPAYNQLENATPPKYTNHQQIYFSKNDTVECLKQPHVSPRECTPCLCIATQLNKLLY